MPTITSAGLGSGLDVNSIVSQLVALERRPIEQLQTQANRLQTQLSSYGKIKSAMSALRDAAAKLTESSTWSAGVAKSSNPTVVAAKAGAAPPVGSFGVTVQSLAAGQSLASPSAYASSAAVVGSGTLRIEVGTWGASQTSFTPKSGGSPVDIVIDPADNTLEKIRDRINAAGAGVSASIVVDLSGARLSLRSTNSGSGEAFRISAVADADGLTTDSAGLSALSYDTNVKHLTQTQGAANSRATINGLAVEAAGNTLSDVVAGLTLDLGQVSATPVDVTIAQDNEAMKKSLTDFVTAYNDLSKILRDQTKYDATSKTAGNLQGERAATMLQSQLRGMLSGSFGASSTFTSLSDIGLELQQDGSLEQVSAKIDAALGKLPELKKLFANVDLAVAGNEGFGRRFKSFGDGVLATDGTLSNASDGIQRRIDANEDRQDALERRVEQVEKRLRAEYTALDAQMARMNGLSQYLSQQLAPLKQRSSE